MLPQEVIRAKRDGRTLSAVEVKDFIEGLTNGSVSEGQVAAFAMAVFFMGMSADEAVGLTLAMRDSGTVLEWDLPGPVVDKHSTGGIGDNISLMTFAKFLNEIVHKSRNIVFSIHPVNTHPTTKILMLQMFINQISFQININS